jgi:hypothetical protein
MKTTAQLLLDGLRLAPFDAGCRLQMVFGVERERKKRSNGSKDYTGQPKTAHMHETHDFTRYRCRLREIDTLLRRFSV